MKNTLTTVFLSLLLSFAANAQVPLNEVISETQKALLFAQQDLEDIDMTLSTVNISFQAVIENETSGGFKILFFGAKKSKVTSNTQSVSFKLTPPDASGVEPVKSRTSSSEALQEALVSGADAISKVDMNSDLKLGFSELTVELKFVVKKGKEGGIDFSIAPLSLDLSAEKGASSSSVHTIKVTYKKK